jgi:hypothetical protein
MAEDQHGDKSDSRIDLSVAMEWFSNLKHRIRLIRKRRQLEQDLHDELAFHIAMREENPSFARVRFGNRTSIQEDCR